MNNRTPHPLGFLRVHPLRTALPLAPTDSLAASIAEVGVLEPLKVCRVSDLATGAEAPGYLYVVDGLDRLRGATAAMLASVPVEIIEPAMVQAVLLHTLLGRKHLTKSALAFVAYPMLQPAMEEARERKMASLKRGDSPSSAERTTGPKTVEELCEALNIGRTLLFLARNVHGFLLKVSPEKREEVTGRILAGELDLTGAVHSLSGNESTAGKERSTPGQLELFDRDMTSLRRRWENWGSLAEAQRKQAAVKFATFLEEAPEEVQMAVIARLERRGK